MGFWKRFFGFEDDPEVVNELDDETEKIVPDILSDDDKANIYAGQMGFLIELKTKAINISIFNPQKGKELEERIDNLISNLNKNSMRIQSSKDQILSLEIDRTMELILEIENEITEVYGENLISEFEKNNRSMDELFDIITTSGNVYSAEANEIRKHEEHLKAISNGNFKLTKYHQHIRNIQIMKSQYRLRMLKFLNGGKDLNPFENTIPTERSMYTQFLRDDFIRIEEQLQVIEASKNELSGRVEFDALKEKTSLLRQKLIGAIYTGEPTMEEVFDDFDTLKVFRDLKLRINFECEYLKDKDSREKARAEQQRIEDEKRKAEEEEAKRIAGEEQAKIEQLKNLSDEDIRKEIARIESDVTADGSRYVNILEYQKKVARAKGLLKDEDEYISEKLEYINCPDGAKFYEIVRNGNREGINYTVLLNSREFGNNTNLIIVSKSDKQKMMEETPLRYSGNNDTYGHNLGSYPVFVLNMMETKFSQKNVNRPYRSKKNGKHFLSISNNSSEEYMGQVYGVLEEVYLELQESTQLSNADLLKDIKCYITIPTERNFIPILQEMRNQGVRYYFQPTPDQGSRNTQHRDKLNIYFDRKDLEKYREKVEPKISTVSDGIVELGGHNFSFNEAVLKECEFPERVYKKVKVKEKEE